mmetsp:Transcript_38041/g.58070  ORF Transcript_38041/g.58070 Transcript_38041/m.58070 type:complete len:131 (-) Transcript_38041:228-620(-)
MQTVKSGGVFADKGGTNLKLESELSDRQSEPVFSYNPPSRIEEQKSKSTESKISEDIPEEIEVPKSDSKHTDSRYLSNYGYNEYDRITTDNEIKQQASIPLLDKFPTPPNMPSEEKSQKSIRESIRIPPS